LALRGGFPTALAIEGDRDRGMWFAAYVQTYLERDLRQLSDVCQPARLPTFDGPGRKPNRQVAQSSRPGQRRCLEPSHRPSLPEPAGDGLPDYSDQAIYHESFERDGEGAKTSLVGLWTGRLARRHSRAGGREPAAGFRLLAGANDLPDPSVLASPGTGESAPSLLARRAGHEVDFILEQDGKLVAIEIKAGSQVSLPDASGIHALKACSRKVTVWLAALVLHAGKARPLGKDVFALPWGWIVKD